MTSSCSKACLSQQLFINLFWNDHNANRHVKGSHWDGQRGQLLGVTMSTSALEIQPKRWQLQEEPSRLGCPLYFTLLWNVVFDTFLFGIIAHEGEWSQREVGLPDCSWAGRERPAADPRTRAAVLRVLTAMPIGASGQQRVWQTFPRNQPALFFKSVLFMLLSFNNFPPHLVTTLVLSLTCRFKP